MSVLSRERPSAPAPAGNLATGLLKLIALLFMFIDHTGKVLFNNAADMRLLGRIAFPIYAWCIVVGFHYTRSVPRYLGRLLLTGLVSQPFYVLVDNEGHPLTGSYSYDENVEAFKRFLETGLKNYKQ